MGLNESSDFMDLVLMSCSRMRSVCTGELISVDRMGRSKVMVDGVSEIESGPHREGFRIKAKWYMTYALAVGSDGPDFILEHRWISWIQHCVGQCEVA